MWGQQPNKDQSTRAYDVLGIVGSDSIPHGVIDRIAIKIESLEKRIRELEEKFL